MLHEDQFITVFERLSLRGECTPRVPSSRDDAFQASPNRSQPFPYNVTTLSDANPEVIGLNSEFLVLRPPKR